VSFWTLILSYRKSEEFSNEVGFTLSATLLLLQEFLPLIKKSEAKKILIISSNLGSIELANVIIGALNAYSVARAALNM
jgi:NAD(P)-dependent dehydrogenase (short-subunit alcohol dehydrogenase family)